MSDEKNKFVICRFVELDPLHVKIADIAIVLVFEVVIERRPCAFADMKIGNFLGFAVLGWS